MDLNTILLILLWLSFFTLHSVLAALPVKSYLMGRLGLSLRSYRLLYIILLFTHLFVIFIFVATIPSMYIFVPGSVSKITGLTLAASGVVICRQAFKSYDGRAFFGLTDLEGEALLRTDGMLQYVRHPLYAGSIMLLLGFFIYIPNVANLVSVALMCIYFIIGIHFEEQKLLKIFGEDYLEYKMRTPMLLPRLGRRVDDGK